MLVNFFKETKPLNFIVIIGFFFAYFFIAVFTTYKSQDLTTNLGLEVLGALFLLIIILYLFNSIIYRSKLKLNDSHSLLIFILFLGFFFKDFLDYKALLLFILHVLFLKRLYFLKFTNSIFQVVFDCGLFLSVLFVLEPFTITYALLLFIAISLFHKITLRIFIITIIGFCTPLFFYFAYTFWFDIVDEFFQIFYFIPNYDEFIYLKDKFLLPLVLISFFTLGSILLKSPKVISVNNNYRKSWVLILFNLLISIFFVLLLPEKTGSELLFILLPASIIVATGSETIANVIVKDIILGFLIICSFFAPFVL